MIHPKKIEVFVDHIEDEICKRTDIDSFEEFMQALAKELYKRYLNNTGLNIYIKKGKNNEKIQSINK